MNSDNKSVNSLKNRILTLAFIGLFIRIAIMPLTFHSDAAFLQYPLKEIASGNLDIFSSYEKKYNVFKEGFFSYPPLYYYTAGLFRAVENLLSPTLNPWIERCWTIYAAEKIGTRDIPNYTYYSDPGKFNLYRNLFLIKAHYLLFDILVACIFLLIIKDKKKKLLAFALWVFNPITILTAYGHGQHDIMATSLVVLALYLCIKRKPGPALAILSAGFMIKLYPILFIPPILLFYSKNLKTFLRLVGWTIAPIIILIGPLYFVTDGAITKFIIHPEASERLADQKVSHLIQKIVMACGYLALLFWSFKTSVEDPGSLTSTLIRIFSTTLLLLCLGVGLEIRYFLWVTPFLVLLMLESRTMFYLVLLQVVSLLVLRYPQYSSLQFGLFRPLEPDLFSSIHSMQNYMSTVIQPQLLYQGAYRVFLFATVLILLWMWRPGEKYVKEKYVAAFSKWATFCILGFTLVITLWGVARYKRMLGPGEYFLSFTRSSKAQACMGKVPLEKNSSFLQPCFEPVANGLYCVQNIYIPGIKGSSGQQFLFRPLDLESIISLEDKTESRGKIFGRNFIFQPIENSKGIKIGLELLDEDAWVKRQERPSELSVLSRYAWVRDFGETLRLIIRNLDTDHVFFISYMSALGVLLLLAVMMLFRASHLCAKDRLKGA
ncbi:MAG TPA: glycosyltransferase family 87 protein [archaeon]|nr:glycosyltransferase family 87 protein [archaeon]